MSIQLSSNLPWELANNLWAQILNPIVATPLLSGRQLTNIALINGINVINHGLGRTQIGWFLTDQNAVASIYRSQPLSSSTLTLTSNAAVTVSLWVY